MVVGYFRYEGCEPIGVFSTLDKAVNACKEEMRGYNGAQVIKYTLDQIDRNNELIVHKERNRDK